MYIQYPMYNCVIVNTVTKDLKSLNWALARLVFCKSEDWYSQNACHPSGASKRKRNDPRLVHQGHCPVLRRVLQGLRRPNRPRLVPGSIHYLSLGSWGPSSPAASNHKESNQCISPKDSRYWLRHRPEVLPSYISSFKLDLSKTYFWKLVQKCS